MPTQTVDVRRKRTALRDLLGLVAEGSEVVLTEGEAPIARVVPVKRRHVRRKAGMHPGAISTSPDFDEPLPETFWTGRAGPSE